MEAFSRSNVDPVLDSTGYPVAIVGGRGYLGRHLSKHLHDLGLPAWVVGRQPSGAHEADLLPYRSSVPDLEASVAGAGTVIHLATLTTPASGDANPSLDLDNIRFTLELIEACVRKGVRHLIFVSSGGTVYGDTGGQPATEAMPARPISSYAIAKRTSEEYLEVAAARGRLAVTILRLTNPYGGSQVTKGDQGVVSALINRMRAGQEIVLLGNTVRDFLWIDDVMSAFALAIASPPTDGARTLNISSGKPTTLVELVEELARLGGFDARYRVGVPRPFDLAYSVLDPRVAFEVLGWRAKVAFDLGLRRCLGLESS